MPALNIELRQRVADMIAAGFDDQEIKRECGNYRVKAIREILQRGLPLSTRIRDDGSIVSEDELRLRRREYKREWQRKNRAKQAFEFTEESDGALNITLVASEQKRNGQKEKPKTGKAQDLSQRVLREVKDFVYAWERLLSKDNWVVSKDNSAPVLSGLKELRTLTSRMIKRVEESNNE